MKRIHAAHMLIPHDIETQLIRLGVPSDKKWTLVDMRTYSPDPILTEVRIYIDAQLRHALASYPMNNRFVYNEEIPGGTEIVIMGITQASQGDWIKMTLVIDEHD